MSNQNQLKQTKKLLNETNKGTSNIPNTDLKRYIKPLSNADLLRNHKASFKKFLQRKYFNKDNSYKSIKFYTTLYNNKITKDNIEKIVNLDFRYIQVILKNS